MFKKFSFFGALSLMVILAGACVAARGTVLNVGGPVYSKVAPADVRVFLSGAEVPGPFDTIGIIRGLGSDFTGDGKILKALKKRAAAMGANGLVLGELQTSGALDRALSGGLGSKKWTATAIRFKSPA